MPAALLRNAVNHGAEVAAAAAATGAAAAEEVERICWVPAFQDKETVTDFCESTDPSGSLESNSSTGHKEYQDRLRAIALRQEGRDKAEIASLLQRPTKFVERWWRKDPHEIPRPAGVHDYMKPEFWRDIEIVRGFAKGLGIYEEVVPTTEWLQPMAFGPSFRDGGQRLKYDKEGRMRMQGNQTAKDGLLPGHRPKLDGVVQKLLSEKQIDDRVLKRPGLLWYPDGSSDAIPHRHECWTALLSFGSPRILTIDDQPVLLRDGDLIIFGTQRHGVPKMREASGAFDDYGGRVSAVFFFMPTGQQAQGSEPWRAIVDGRPSRKASAMLTDASLGSAAALAGLAGGAKAEEVRHLEDLGFSTREAAAALKATSFDLARAAEVLLGGGGPALLLGFDGDAAGGGGGLLGDRPQTAGLLARLAELQEQRRRQHAATTTCASDGVGGDDGDNGEEDERLARRLQDEEDSMGLMTAATLPSCCSSGGDVDAEELAILQQLQELEQASTSGAGSSEALQRQFEQYEEMLDAQEAEEWDGRGDLMVREWRRAHLNIEQQEPSTVYALGCGHLREQALFELLSLHSVRVLYDFRANAEAAPSRHLLPESLKIACKARAIVYRHIPLGREGAYGILKHLREDEGRNALAEIVWHARRKRSAILGAAEDWRGDHRLAIASRLREAGHTVMHITIDGRLEEHPEDAQIPDHLLGEEQRLRTLEKQRQAGELRRPQKSAVSRSTEVVAKRLAQPREEIDVAAELRKADTQAELCRAQRRLAGLQRRSEAADAKAGLGPKLVGVSRWVHEEAEQQKVNLAAGKTKDGKERGKVTAGGPAPSNIWIGSGGTDGGNPRFAADAPQASASASASSSSSAAVAAQPSLLIECLACGVPHPWELLASGDGRCESCLGAQVARHADASAGALLAESPRSVAPPFPTESSHDACGAAAANCVDDDGPAAASSAPARAPSGAQQPLGWRARRHVQRRAAGGV